MIWLYKILFLCFFILFLYIMSFYSIVIVLLFVFEYFYLFFYLFNIYKNYYNYYVIDVIEIDLSILSSLDIWIEYCKLLAFKRIYFLFMKKKIKIYNIFLMFIILILHIPVKFIKIFLFFIKSDKNFYDTLLLLYIHEFWLLKKLKIEVFDCKIHLNCFTVGKLSREILKRNPLLTQKDFLSAINDFKREVSNFNELDYETEKMDLLFAKDKNNTIMFKPHFGYVQYNNTLHSTSKIPVVLLHNQKVSSPMPSLIANHAKNPGTIVTTNVGSITRLERYKIIPRSEVVTIMYNNKNTFDLNDKELNIISNKEVAFLNIFNRYFIDNNIIGDAFFENMLINNYRFTLQYSSNDSWVSEYNFLNKYPIL
jgi:hypothetical protein